MILGQNIKRVYNNGKEIRRVHSYGKLVWEKLDYSVVPFSVRAIDDYVDIELHYAYKQGSGGAIDGEETIADFKYSINGAEWYISIGESIRIHKNEVVNIIASNIFFCKIKGTCDIYGNIMSLLYGDNFVGQTSWLELPSGYARLGFFEGCDIRKADNLILPATTLTRACYSYMFLNCSSLISAPELPATTLTEYAYAGMFQNCTSLTAPPVIAATKMGMYCCQRMFQNCISLTTAPELPATTLAEECYSYMFLNCSNLTNIPEKLPATTLKEACYAHMFQGCSSLTTSPKLPATTLSGNCYIGMFQNCTSLTASPDLPANYLAYACYMDMFKGCSKLNYVKCSAYQLAGGVNSFDEGVDGWLSGVSPTGTFVCLRINNTNPLLDYIPSTWTVEYLN